MSISFVTFSKTEKTFQEIMKFVSGLAANELFGGLTGVAYEPSAQLGNALFSALTPINAKVGEQIGHLISGEAEKQVCVFAAKLDVSLHTARNILNKVPETIETYKKEPRLAITRLTKKFDITEQQAEEIMSTAQPTCCNKIICLVKDGTIVGIVLAGVAGYAVPASALASLPLPVAKLITGGTGHLLSRATECLFAWWRPCESTPTVVADESDEKECQSPEQVAAATGSAGYKRLSIQG